MNTKAEDLSKRIERMRQKVIERRLYLNSCLGQQEIEEFEQRYQIQLPEDYRQFLLKIGNGSTNGPPHYGLLPLSDTVKSEQGQELRPNLSFPLTETWVWEDEVSWENGQPEILAPIFSNGHLYLGTEGCGEDWILIVTGSEQGKVWNLSDVGAGPCVPERDFLSWYEYWLDGNNDWWTDNEQEIN
jgi:hypothetical protein